MPEDKKTYKIDNIIERSEKTQEILTYIPRWIIRSGITIIGILIIAFILLSKFIKYPDVVTSSITLRSDNPPSQYFAKEDDRSFDFTVENGSHVAIGQVLAVVNDIDTLFADTPGIFNISPSEDQLNSYSKDELVFNIYPGTHENIHGIIKLNSNLTSSITVDQKVNIKLFNYNYLEYGTLSGKILTKTTLIDEDHNFDIFEIELLNGLKTDHGKEVEFIYGIQGNADIITHDITVFDRIFDKLLSYM